MSLRELRKTWDRLARRDPLWAVLSLPEKRGRRWDTEEFFAWGRDEIESALDHVSSLGGVLGRKRALDFGCGVGRLTRAMAGEFDRVEGVDIAPTMIRLAERYNRDRPGCRFHVYQSDDLELFADSTFDFVYSSLTLQHMEPGIAARYICEFLRVLRPGAWTVFQVPDRPTSPVPSSSRGLRGRVKSLLPGPVLRAYQRAADVRNPRMGSHGIPKAEVVGLVERNGGTVVDAVPDEWVPNWLGHRYWVHKIGA